MKKSVFSLLKKKRLWAYLIGLRFKQAGRILREIGFWLTLAFLIIIAVLSATALTVLETMNAQTIGLIVGAIVLSVHFYRKDLYFLQAITHTKRTFKMVLLAEYLLLFTPLLIFYALLANWVNVGSVFVTCVGTALFPFEKIISKTYLYKLNKKELKTFSYPFIPVALFELKMSIETDKQGIFWLFFYTLGLFSFLHIACFIASLVLLSMLVLEAFKYNEPWEMVHWTPHFVRSKIGLNWGGVAVGFAPILLSALSCQSDYYLVIIYLSLLLFTTTLLGIVLKYATYDPLQSERFSTITLIIFFTLLIPGGILIGFILSAIYYRRAKQNMRYYYA